MDWKCFRDNEAGAITVDWVVLTAALIGLCMVILVPFAFGLDSVVSGVAAYISSIQTGY
jgi:hypothetical protein